MNLAPILITVRSSRSVPGAESATIVNQTARELTGASTRLNAAGKGRRARKSQFETG